MVNGRPLTIATGTYEESGPRSGPKTDGRATAGTVFPAAFGGSATGAAGSAIGATIGGLAAGAAIGAAGAVIGPAVGAAIGATTGLYRPTQIDRSTCRSLIRVSTDTAGVFVRRPPKCTLQKPSVAQLPRKPTRLFRSSVCQL